jgi:putative endonuclease
MPKSYYTYIVASRSQTLYIGVTSNIEQRIWQHKNKAYEGFSARYDCNRLVWFETYSHPITAITREKELKGWLRVRKIELIHETNPTWSDLSEGWGQSIFPTAEPAVCSRSSKLHPK